jgi:hypothetical protein
LLLRLLIADLVGKDALRARESARSVAISPTCSTDSMTQRRAPRRFRIGARTSFLVSGFLRQLLDLHLEFVDQIERELTPAAPERRPRSA